MKKNIIFKLFTLFFIYLLFTVCAFAIDGSSNTVSKIEVEQTQDKNFNINLFFDTSYKGSAFIQKRENGSYYVFLPDTQMGVNNTKVIYKNGKDKSIINVKPEEKPYIKDDVETSYVRLAVDLPTDYTIKLISKIISENQQTGTTFSFNFKGFLIILTIGIIIFLITCIYKYSKSNIKSNSYTSFPAGFLNSPKEYTESIKNNANQKPHVLPKVNIKKTIKNADSNSFSCFDLPLVSEEKNNNYEFKSTLEKTSSLLNNEKLKSGLKHSNPIKKSSLNEASELRLPIAEEVLNIKENQEEEQKKEAELISILNITPNKGFYLTTVNDMFALFGFVNENIFLFKKFNDLTQINLQARFYDKNGQNDIYIVRLDSYKAMVEISESNMQELAVL